MPLISYAQNAEDVLLWRALGAVQDGFYIDVGANDPQEGSITKLFYDAGWRGINIEPMPAYREVLQRARPRDINLALACGATDGSITLFDTPAINGWASTDAATAQAHRADGIAVVETEVPMRTLAGICAEHAPATIHFLKIDVEGFEAEVLRGMDLRRWRPWIVVVEATLPNSTVTNHEHWEHLVLSCCYQFAFFDGLNRYYVADEQAHLLPLLAVPPNVLDGYVSHYLAEAWRAIDELQNQLALAGVAAARDLERARAASATVQQHADAAEISRRETAAWAQDLEASLHAVHASTSWRVTKPLRLAGRLRQDGQLRTLLVPAPRRVLMALAQMPLLRRLAFGALRRAPGLEKRFLAWYASVRGNGAGIVPPGVPRALAHLPQSARHVLADLERPRPTHHLSDH
ncbi:FkbM family methyltransferase [Duganella sp. FT27W]|uniref:FkbM family methyltransferase n=1 Tax=Duganella sp. FT27W TaxID=2654636 RepID=UPI00128CD85D|nr:FkbM family methyltransferase [Duganella sp. FT27W]MPQ57269.1 FkbM family methyltransferase [Duganella sp. FT27W]